MNKADYKFYSEIYGGTTIKEEDFEHFMLKASAKADALLNDEKKDLEADDKFKLCVCEICDILYDEKTHEGINYERNDGYWVSYDGKSTDDIIKKCVFTWLGSSGALYRGK